MLVKFVHTNKDCWEDYLDTCVYAYNTSKHESLRFSPFDIMFGCLAVLLIDLQTHHVDKKTFVIEKNDADIEEHLKDQRKILDTAKTNILAAQKRQKEQYDHKHSNPDIFKNGALVLKKDMKRKKRAGGKMDLKWLGPYKIIKALGRGIYRVQSTRDPSQIVAKVHGIHLKPYHPPDEKVHTL